MSGDSQKLNRYVAAVNAIDDYFEYSCKSPEDQRMVQQILNTLTKHLKNDEHDRLTTSNS